MIYSRSLLPQIAKAFAFLPKTHATINKIYSRDPSRFFAAAKESEHFTSRILSQIRIEHQLMAIRVLGILIDGTPSDAEKLFSKAIPKTFRYLSALPKETRVTIEEALKKDRADEADATDFYNMVVLTLGACYHFGLAMKDTPLMQKIFAYAEDRNDPPEIIPLKTQAEAVEELRAFLGADHFNGTISLFDDPDAPAVPIIEELNMLCEYAGLEVDEYTHGCQITSADAPIISAGTPDVTACSAFLLMILRAIKRDRDYVLELSEADHTLQIAAAHDARDQAVSERDEAFMARERAFFEAKSLRHRVEELETALASLEKDNAKLRAELKTHAGDSSELASLRQAVYQSSQSDDSFKPSSEQRRKIISESIIIIGGHPAWARTVSERLPVRAYPTGTTCPKTVLLSASEVWIQAAYMSHTEFFAAIATIRQANIPVHYFSSTGAERCIHEIEYGE